MPDGDGVNEHGSENEANLFGQSVPAHRLSLYTQKCRAAPYAGGVVRAGWPEAKMRLALGRGDDYLGPWDRSRLMGLGAVPPRASLAPPPSQQPRGVYNLAAGIRRRAPTHPPNQPPAAPAKLLFILINRPCGEKLVLVRFLASQPCNAPPPACLPFFTHAWGTRSLADRNVEINFTAACKNFINLLPQLYIFGFGYTLSLISLWNHFTKKKKKFQFGNAKIC